MSKDEKNKVKLQELIDTQTLAARLEELAAGVRCGSLVVSLGTQSLTLSPSGSVEVEIKASSKADREKIEIELSWRPGLRLAGSVQAERRDQPA